MDDQKAVAEIMRLIRDSEKDYRIEQAIRHALQDAFLSGTKHGLEMASPLPVASRASTL